MARYGREFRQQGRGGRYGRDPGYGAGYGGMRSDAPPGDWRQFGGEEGWYGGGYGAYAQPGYSPQFESQFDRGYSPEVEWSRGYTGRGGGYFGNRGGGFGGRTARDWTNRAGGGDQIRASEIMTHDPEVVTPDATIEEVAGKMRDLDVGIIPVVDSADNRRLHGVVTDRDITVRATAEGKLPAETKVSDVMSTDVGTVNKNDLIGDVFEVMRRDQVRRVPVTDREGRLVGIIAEADLVVDYAHGAHRAQRLENTLEEVYSPGRPRGRGKTTAQQA